MAAADFIIKQGDTSPVLTDSLTYTDGSAVDLTSASVRFVMRALTSPAPTTNLPATIVNPSTGQISYSFTTTDSATAGMFMANWLVTFPSGATMTFPTDGYIEVNVEENLITPGGQQLMSLTEAKGYLNIPSSDRTRDTKLLQFLHELTPVIEEITGFIIQRPLFEIYDGQGDTIPLRHRPIVSVESVVEYRGPVVYTLTQVPTPDLGTIYSYTFETAGRIVRRTVGGGSTDFPRGKQSVNVHYTAGRASVPANVTGVIKEALRIHFQDTQQGRPRAGGAGGGFEPDDPTTGVVGFLVSGRIRELRPESPARFDRMTIPVSTVPLAIANLTSQIQTQVNVGEGPNAGAVLTIAGAEGEDAPNDIIVVATNVTRVVREVIMRGDLGLDSLSEAYTIDVLCSSWSGDPDPVANMNRAWVLASYVETAVRTDPTVGSEVLIGRPESSRGGQSVWTDSPIGRQCDIVVGIYLETLN